MILLVSFTFDANSAPPLAIQSARPAPELESSFQRSSGWIGADGNYSVPISEHRRLWFYSDTIIGDVVDGKRVRSTIINNSVGIETVAGGKSTLDFYWPTRDRRETSKSTNERDQQVDMHRAWIEPADKRGWFWLVGGAYVDGKVQLLLWQVIRTDENSVFGFEIVGVSMATIENPLDPQNQWQVSQRPVPLFEKTERHLIQFGSAVLVKDGYFIVFGSFDDLKQKHLGRRMIMARHSTATMPDSDAWEYWNGESWQSELGSTSPIDVQVATEYSVSFYPSSAKPDEGTFVLVTQDAGLSPTIVGYTADSLEGPWSSKSILYRCPDVDKSKNVFVYSGKAHASMSTTSELVITYAANSWKFSDLFEDASLYWPRFVRVSLQTPLVP
jgi:hypothetical protein